MWKNEEGYSVDGCGGANSGRMWSIVWKGWIRKGVERKGVGRVWCEERHKGTD